MSHFISPAPSRRTSYQTLILLCPVHRHSSSAHQTHSYGPSVCFQTSWALLIFHLHQPCSFLPFHSFCCPLFIGTLLAHTSSQADPDGHLTLTVSPVFSDSQLPALLSDSTPAVLISAVSVPAVWAVPREGSPFKGAALHVSAAKVNG